MALTTERIKDLWLTYSAGLPRSRATCAFARAIEAEVRKDDEALIRQLVEALEYHRAQTRPIELTDEAITAGRAWLMEVGYRSDITI